MKASSNKLPTMKEMDHIRKVMPGVKRVGIQHNREWHKKNFGKCKCE